MKKSKNAPAKSLKSISAMRAVVVVALLMLAFSPSASVAKDLRNATVINAIRYCASVFAQSPVSESARRDCMLPISARLAFDSMLALAAKKDPKSCGLTGTGDHEALAVVDWLGKHAEVHAMKFDDGIQEAIRSLWPCVR